jgi:hypothetical protein
MFNLKTQFEWEAYQWTSKHNLSETPTMLNFKTQFEWETYHVEPQKHNLSEKPTMLNLLGLQKSVPSSPLQVREDLGHFPDQKSCWI